MQDGARVVDLMILCVSELVVWLLVAVSSMFLQSSSSVTVVLVIAGVGLASDSDGNSPSHMTDETRLG